MTAIVHGWCGYVEKANEVVFQQMVLNKLWIPDVLIDIIKDYLYIDKVEVLRKYYKQYINRSVRGMSTENQLFADIYGRDRIIHWRTGYLYYGSSFQLHGAVCVTCGDCSQRHDNINGCCLIELDIAGELLHLEQVDAEVSDETIDEINAQANVEEDNVEGVNAVQVSSNDAQLFHTDPTAVQIVRTALAEAREEAAMQRIVDVLNNVSDYNYYDIESEMADFQDYMREIY